MELMAGLEPLEAQIAQIHEYETPAKGYLETGGIIRRIRLLANLAQTLAEHFARTERVLVRHRAQASRPAGSPGLTQTR